MAISANGGSNGLLWASTPLAEDAFVKVVRGAFWVFDANSLQLLWSTAEKEPEDNFNYAKFCPPTVANGKVYLATFSDKLNVYGLAAPRPEALPEWAATGKPPKKSHGHGRMGK